MGCYRPGKSILNRNYGTPKAVNLFYELLNVIFWQLSHSFIFSTYARKDSKHFSGMYKTGHDNETGTGNEGRWERNMGWLPRGMENKHITYSLVAARVGGGSPFN